jgi:hypothetical protein
MKADAVEEALAAEPVISRLGGRLLAVSPAASAARSLGQVVVIEKVSPTPSEFPRRAGLPGRRPLAG